MLSRIDILVDSIVGCTILSMMDVYKGYHQIFLVEEDMYKSIFITEKGVYCYRIMPFSLKNVGATYQRLVNKIFEKLIGKTIEVYVDDMFVKTIRK